MANYVNYGSQNNSLSMGSMSQSFVNDSLPTDSANVESETIITNNNNACNSTTNQSSKRNNSFGNDNEDVNNESSVVHKFLTRSNSNSTTEQDVIDELMSKSPIKYNEIVVGAVIGAGYFGEVKKGVWQAREVALKRIRRSSFRHDSEFTLLVKECAIISRLKHENIVEFIGVCSDPLKSTEYIIVTAFANGGSLRHKIDRNSHSINEKVRIKITCGITKGMKYLHGHKPQIIHRDLTCANVLLSDNNRALICDFGISRMKSDSEAMTAAMGSLAYMAPEVFRGDHYDASCDVFSFAIVLYEMITFARVPPKNISPHLWASLCATEGRRLSLTTVPLRYKTLIERCWQDDAKLRPGFDEIDNYCSTSLNVSSKHKNRTGLVSQSSMSSSLTPPSTLEVTASMALANNMDETSYVSYVDVAKSNATNQNILTASGSMPIDINQVENSSVSSFAVDKTNIYKGHSGFVCCVRANEGSDTILTGSTDHTIKVWSLQKHGVECRFTIEGHQGYVFCLMTATINNQSLLLSGSRDKTVRVWNPNGELLSVLKGHQHGVRDLQVLETQILTASEDHTLLLWDALTAEKIHHLKKHTGVVYTSEFIDTNVVASGGDDSLIHIWDLRSNSININTLSAHSAGVQRIRSGAKEYELYSCSKDKKALKWDLRTGNVVATFAGHRDTVFDMSVVESSSCLVTTGADGFVRFFDSDSGNLRYEARVSKKAVLCLQTLHEGRVVLTGGMDKSLAARFYHR